jgi:hypothetical protein
MVGLSEDKVVRFFQVSGKQIVGTSANRNKGEVHLSKTPRARDFAPTHIIFQPTPWPRQEAKSEQRQRIEATVGGRSRQHQPNNTTPSNQHTRIEGKL